MLVFAAALAALVAPAEAVASMFCIVGEAPGAPLVAAAAPMLPA
jgi:hypothetical protein